MVQLSKRTFQAEASSFRNIDRIFWGSEREYPIDPFSGIVEKSEFEDLETQTPDDLWISDAPPADSEAGIRRFGRGGLFYLEHADPIRRIGDAAGKADAEFEEAFWESLGIDISEELERYAGHTWRPTQHCKT
jgi:hypothetical protein